MLTLIASCIQRALSSEIVIGSQSASKFKNLDGLSKKRSSSKQKKYNCDDSFSKPLLKVKDEKDKKRSTSSAGFDVKATSIRVKVKMTKQEAARLLSKCKDGGVLEFRDVALELEELPVNRVSIVSPCPGTNAVLDGIPEES